MNIRLGAPSIEQDDIDAIAAVLRTGYLVQGKQVAEFEGALLSYTGTAHAVCMTNCTAALQLALLAKDVRPGDIVLVPAYSWLSTANVVELCGAQPVFVDIDARTFNMAPEALDATLTRLFATAETRGRVRGILPVHTFGQTADMSSLSQLARARGLFVIEDAACALGAKHHGKFAGQLGDLGCFSFHPRKAITTGEGGFVSTDSADAANHMRSLRNHGLDPTAASPDFIRPGFNVRMTEFQAAFGKTQLKKFPRILASRKVQAERYQSLLSSTDIAPPFVAPGNEHVFQSYVTLVPPKARDRRDAIIKQVREAGVEVTIGTWHMPLTTYFRTRYGYKPGDFPVADDVFARAMSLPMHEQVTEADQAQVAKVVSAAVAGA